MTERAVGRFAPSPTGPAHPGTLLSGLLAWLQARASGARFVLRIEDIDPQRARAEWAEAMLGDLAWFGLDWDEVVVQSARRGEHEAALDRLGDRGLLYGCTCTRADLRRTAAVAADGGRLYPGSCRERRLGAGDWRGFEGAVRMRLHDGEVVMRHLHGHDVTFRPAHEMGDPILRRKDGAMAYNLAVVVDDIAQGVDRIVRGRDLLPSSGIHVALYRELEAEPPSYWHHPLLLEARSNGGSGGALSKLAKLHGSVGAAELREHLAPEQVCGFLAGCVGLVEPGATLTPRELLAEFDPGRVPDRDTIVTWADGRLHASAPP